MNRFVSANNLKTYQKLKIFFKENEKGTNKSNYLSKFSIYENYLLIFNEKLYSFEIDFSDNRASQISDFHKGEELIDIVFIDPSNIFLKYTTHYLKYNIFTNLSNQINFVKVVNGAEFPIEQISSLYFNDKLPFRVGEQDSYFGIFGTETGELFITKDISEDSSFIKVTCESIKQFDEPIKKLFFKKYTSQSETFMGKEFVVILVVTKSSAYLLQIKLLTDELNNDNFHDQFKKPNRWFNLFRYDENEEIHFSIQFDSNFSFPISCVVLRENFEIDHYEFSRELEQGREIISGSNKLDFQKDLKNSIISDKHDKFLKNNDIVGVHHFDSIIYVCMRTKVYIYNMKNNKIMDFWIFDSEPIKDLYIYDNGSKEKRPYYYLVFLTSRNVYFSRMDKNFEDQGFQIKKTVVSNFDDKKTRGSIANDIPKGKIKCFYQGCNNEGDKRCSACKIAYYCSEDHQELDWETHRKQCTYEGELDIYDDNSEEIERIEYKNHKYPEKRREILGMIKDPKNLKTLNKAIDMGYHLIDENRKEILRINQNVIKNLKMNNIEKDEIFYENLTNLFKMYEDYICNILFLTHIISQKRNKTETQRIVNKLIREMDEKLEYFKYLDLMIDYIRLFLDNHLAKNYEHIEELFVRSIKIITTIAKLYYKLGEFSQYEINLVKCIERIEKAYITTNSSFVLAYTYFVIGNLYIELDYLGKAILLYCGCLSLINDNPRESEFVKELYIMVNYNLGVLYYITDQYTFSKNRLETLIKFNKDEISDQMALFYETLGEVELEYKNFQVSYMCLQKSLEIRSKLKIDDVKKRKRTNILLDNLMHSIEKDVHRKNHTTKNIMNSPVDKGTGKNEKDLEEILNYMKILNEEKADNIKNESKLKQKQDFDVDEMEKFFLFMSKLTPQQINVLNETQGNIANPNIIKLPIVFSAEFKNLLSLNQRLEICNMKLMSLKRNKVLKDPMNRIEIENLNYEALSSRSFQNNLTNIKNYFVVNKILKNSENNNNLSNSQMNSLLNNPITKVPVNQPHPRANRNTIINFMISPKHLTKKMDMSNHASGNQIKIQNENKLKKEMNNPEFIAFKDAITRYSEMNPYVRLTVNDEELYNIFKQLEKEDVNTILDNPEIFFSFMEENEDSFDNKKEEKKNINKSYIKDHQKIQEVEEESENDNERNRRNNGINTSNRHGYSNSSLNQNESKGFLNNDNSRSYLRVESNKIFKSEISDND